MTMLASSSSSTLSLPFGPVMVTTSTQLLTGGFLLPARSYGLVVAGAGITSQSASYGGDIVATSAAAPARIPGARQLQDGGDSPRRPADLLAARRRHSAGT
ncbi:MAG: hypothetical protein R3E78_17315 [Burkholderiaceae bacterium]